MTAKGALRLENCLDGINLYVVSGSGANGRVHKEDVKLIRRNKRGSHFALQNNCPHNIAWQEIQGTGHRCKIMKKDTAFLLKISKTILSRSPAQIEKWKKFQTISLLMVRMGVFQ